MNSCALHKGSQAVIYCTREKQFYCLKCISKHDGHGFTNIEEYQQEQENQIKYANLVRVKKCLVKLNNIINIMISTRISQIQMDIKRLRINRNEMHHGMVTKQNYTNTTKDIQLAINKLIQTQISKPATIAKDTVHYWKGNTIILFNATTRSKKSIKLKQEINSTATSISVGNRIFIVGGGEDGKYSLDSVNEIDVAKRVLIQRESLLCKKDLTSLCRCSSFIYSIGGCDEAKYQSLDDCEKYDFHANQWQQLPPINIPRHRCATFVWNQSIYAICGTCYHHSEHHFLNSLEMLKAGSDKWIDVSVHGVPTLRSEIHGIAINDSVVLYGGAYKDGSKWIF